MLADGAESRFNVAVFAPGFEAVAPELASFVTDQVSGRGSCFGDGSAQEGSNLLRGRLVFQFQDRHAFCWWVMWSLVRRQMLHACILDLHLLPQQSDLLVRSIKLGLQPHATVGTVGCLTAGVAQAILCKRDGM